MPPKRLGVVLCLLCAHAALIALGDALPEAVAPAIAGTVYLPLWLLQTIGLPVFARAEAGGWPGPSTLGWILLTAIWITLWWTLVTAIAKVRS